MVKEVSDSCREIAVDAVHVTGRGHDGGHVLVAILYAFLHLRMMGKASLTEVWSFVGFIWQLAWFTKCVKTNLEKMLNWTGYYIHYICSHRITWCNSGKRT